MKSIREYTLACSMIIFEQINKDDLTYKSYFSMLYNSIKFVVLAKTFHLLTVRYNKVYSTKNFKDRT